LFKIKAVAARLHAC